MNYHTNTRNDGILAIFALAITFTQLEHQNKKKMESIKELPLHLITTNGD